MLFSPRTAPNGSVQTDAIPVWSRSIGSWKFSLGRHPYAARELEGHYDKASESWHATISKLGFEDAYAGLVRQAFPEVARIAQSGPLKVLDAGVGTGAFSAAFASHCPRAVELTGVDISSEMLRHADQHLQNCNLAAELLQGDVNNLPFEDDTFDVILIAHVVEHMADPHHALAELYRVLKPGGVLIACVTQRSSAGAYIQLKWRTHLVDAQTAVHWLRQSGLRDVRTLQLSQSAAAWRFSNGYVGCKPCQDTEAGK